MERGGGVLEFFSGLLESKVKVQAGELHNNLLAWVFKDNTATQAIDGPNNIFANVFFKGVLATGLAKLLTAVLYFVNDEQ